MPLKEYAHKRAFVKSKEPQVRPSKRKASSKHLMFVVQEHHASHLHYDFRLEWEGVLKSWAVPKGPSQDPKVKRLAVQVEDHPLAYGKFEGIIPQGEYGAGQVLIWDTGTWEPVGNVKVGFKKGHIEFRLKGKKLHGTWNLVKTARGTSRSPQWLLIKKDMHTKRSHKDQGLSDEDEEPHYQRPPAFIEPQLAELVKIPPAGSRWLHETKFDGYRTQARIADGKVTLKTRTGLDWTTKYPLIAESLKQLPVHDVILDGEIVWLDAEGLSDFQKLQEALKTKANQRIFFYVFDLLFLNGQDFRAEPLFKRKRVLRKVLYSISSPLIRLSDHIEGYGEQLFKLSCARGSEGLISKDKKSFYQSGRSSLWVKSKCVSRQEFVIGGFSESRGVGANFGALLLGTYEDGKLKYVGKVGTGFSEALSRQLFQKLKKLEIKKNSFQTNRPIERGLHWIRPTMVAEVSFANWTRDGLLRSAVFHGIRKDKSAREIHTEKLTHPQKILFKSEGLTKEQIAQYYQDIADLILPHMVDRPVVLKRCPEGSFQNCFFQKHLAGKLPPGLKALRIREKNGVKNYFTISSKQGLLSLSQLRAFELHSWNCHSAAVENPDQVVLDLDPGENVPWKQVIACALEVKEILDALGLKSFVKVSGGKGLHIHIPIEPLYSWSQIKNFSRAIGREMVRRHPDLYVISMNKKKRAKKIFIDYFRNGRGATAVVPYSLRARKISSVALPVSWNDLKKIQGPDVFTLQKAQEHLRKRRQDPWHDFFKIQQRISILEPVIAP